MLGVKNQYYYKFLNDVSTELASIAMELENSVFTSPRTMLTHSRTFIEGVVQRVINIEKMSDIGCDSLTDRLHLLKANDLVTEKQLHALHQIRKFGNEASHQTRPFRYLEALTVWESLYIVIRWFVEVYASPAIEVPAYQDPSTKLDHTYDIQELEFRLQELEDRLIDRFQSLSDLEQNEDHTMAREDEPVHVPGETIVRTLYFKDQSIDIPYFLRDAFLLPQRFENSERFMIALGGAQQARIMSELPVCLEGISSHVKRYNETNEQMLFDDLVTFIEHERIRRKIMQDRPGELFLFFREEYIIMTERLASIPLTEEHFTGFPDFLRQLKEDGIEYVRQLPQELLILAKYEQVGIGKVEKLFRQLLGK
ncbi:hypothetical protein J416_06193 [Gracilibacillus halophilus YIM-C55.5]|uniref:DUF4145 domain-containing protein n=1 Tax=Gracilibacillus halophilus YIM-C55.5 TaxID=1308866 RepID=N4WED0_9BACI|nr:DUF4145 domain-containing protein [Gracilibacillus halophilus]ENH97579.1 hypothetical protein J416_06193 [Gracilibacillus halophilus YIM-C55.5]